MSPLIDTRRRDLLVSLLVLTAAAIMASSVTSHRPASIVRRGRRCEDTAGGQRVRRVVARQRANALQGRVGWQLGVASAV